MRIIQILIFLLLVSACSQKQATVKKYYRLADTNSQNTEQSDSHTLLSGTLWIKRPEAHSILGNRPMVATDDEGALQQLSHHSWIESPKVLVQELLTTHLKNHWENVVTDRPLNDEFHQLHSRILAFEKNKNTAKIQISFKLYDQDKQLISQQTLSHNQALDGNLYADYANAMSTAMTVLLKQLEFTP